MKKFILSSATLLVFASFIMAQIHHESKPMYSDTLLFENWSNGSFTTNQWTLPPCDTTTWTISTVFGNPPQSANFHNYKMIDCDYPLTSKEIPGTNNYTELRYDIFLVDSSHSIVKFSVDLLDGSVWYTMDYINDISASFPWTTRVVDISNYCQNNFNIRFRPIDFNYNGDHVDIDNILIGSYPLGIPEHQNADFMIQPNPVISNFDLILKNFENLKTQIILLDVTGKVVQEEEVIPTTNDYTKNINVANLSKGIYFCKIRSDEKSCIKKIILTE